MSLALSCFASPDQAATALVGAIAADLHAALQRRDRALLLVSGGSSPRLLLQTLACQPLPWDRIDISLVDERSVAAGASAANGTLVQSTLLAGAARAARWIALMPPAVFDAAEDAWQAARRAAHHANHNPALRMADVVILGLGNDGHTASLFVDAPQWPDASTTAARYLALQPQHAPHARITLSLPALRAQGQCYLWTIGAEKLATLQHLQQPDTPPRLPPAGPVARLIADPGFLLSVYCSL